MHLEDATVVERIGSRQTRSQVGMKVSKHGLTVANVLTKEEV